MKILTLFLCAFITATSAFAIDARSVIPGAPFDAESHPNDPNRIQGSGGVINWIQSGTWVRYDNLNFGPAPVVQIRVKASSPVGGGGTIRVKHGSLSGPVIATVIIPSTGNFANYRDFTAPVDPSFIPNSGGNTLFFEFADGSNAFMNLAEFSFATIPLSWDVQAGDYFQESAPSDPLTIKKDGSYPINNLINITNGSWVDYGQFDFGGGMNYLWVDVSAANDSPPGVTRKIDFRMGSITGEILGSVEIPNTGGLFKPLGLKLPTPVSGIKRLFLTFSGGTGNLFNISRFRFQRFAPDYQPAGPITARVERDPQAEVSTPALNFNVQNTSAPVQPYNGAIGYISNGSWVGYLGHQLPVSVNRISIEASCPSNGTGSIGIHLGSPTGTLIGTVPITSTGSWNTYSYFTRNITTTASGPQDIYLKFTGSLNVKSFRFHAIRTITAFPNAERSPGVIQLSANSDVITGLSGGSWARYNGVNFGEDANLVTVTAATPNKGGLVEMRLDSTNGPLIAAIDVTYTGSFTHFREYTQRMTQSVSGTRDVYLKFGDTHGEGGNRFNLKNFIFETKGATAPSPSDQGSLLVYDPVPGLDPSPYYTYAVQKVSDLNAPLKQNATNWLAPFAWFTECKTGSEPYSGSYYSARIGGWSHTYCHFEMGKNTPIVVKITRKNSNPHGAPAGKIFMANAHPAQKVLSCEIINGEVYVTMKEPALVTIDIDGQMDTRDTLNGPITVNNRQNGSHAASIFANPVITDKPGVRPASLPASGPIIYIEPQGNDLSPQRTAKAQLTSRTDWTTAIFLPGVHSFSGFDAPNQPKKWEPGDLYTMTNDKTIYLPGDALLYGNFFGQNLRNFRIYGLGAISGRHIPHPGDQSWSTYPGWNAQFNFNFGIQWQTMPINVNDGMTNCHFEGVAIIDPAFHGITSLGGSASSKKWHKQIGWRANTDMGGIPGIIEDCFFRIQDDGPYVEYNDFRRNTLWFDVNGAPFRGSFMTRNAFGDRSLTVVEDCDIIYARCTDPDSVLSMHQGDTEGGDSGTYPDGTRNTAQHILFRNIRVTDPRPTRSPFKLEVPNRLTSGISGMRFENVEFRHPNANGQKSLFYGTATKPITHLYFDGVTIEGKKMTQALFNDTSLFQSSFTSNFVFRDAPSDVGPGTPDLSFKYNINSGGPAYTAADGSVFVAGAEGSTYTTTAAISGTTDDTLYQSERYGDFFSYSIPVPNGDYEVTLMFAEIYQNQANQRVFHVDLEGIRVISNLDIWAEVGKNAAHNETHVASVNDGQLNISFSRVQDNAKVSAIKIKELPVQYNLSLNDSPNGSVSLNPPGGTYPAGTDVILTATPQSSYRFVYWSGSLSGPTNPETLTMSENRSVTAIFRPVAATLLVVGDAANMNPSDITIRDRLVNQGHSVQAITASAATTANASGKTLVLISSTVTSGDVTTKFRDTRVPVINWETALQDDFFGNTDANQGTSSPQTVLNIVNSGHALAAGLVSGNRTVATVADSGGFSWGEPGGAPIIVARLTDGSNRPCIYAYETDATMSVATAPARRVHLFLQNNTFLGLNGDGQKLFDAAVGWAIRDLPPREVFPVTEYVVWASEMAVMGGPEEDDDQDGRTNFEEYAFGQNPKNGASVNPIVVPFSKETGTFSYTRRKYSLTTLSYSVWYSINLGAGSWIKDTGAIESTPTLVGDVETVPVTISASLLTHPQLFIQVRAE